MKRTIPVLLGLSLLAGCSWLPGKGGNAGADGWNHWLCDSRETLVWQHPQGNTEQVEMRLGNDRTVYLLKQEPAASGAFYTDGVLAFHARGEEGLAYWVATDDLIGRGCRAGQN